MESAYQHLLRTQGEAEAKKYVYYVNSYLIISKHTSKELLDDIKEVLPSIGTQGALDELAAFVRQAYSIEDFLNETKEEEFEDIILNFEKWDKRHPDFKFFELTNSNYLNK
jgi:hypothetical protein